MTKLDLTVDVILNDLASFYGLPAEEVNKKAKEILKKHLKNCALSAANTVVKFPGTEIPFKDVLGEYELVYNAKSKKFQAC